MQQKRFLKEGYCARILFFLSILCAVIGVAYTAAYVSLDNTLLRGSQPTLFSDGWSAVEDAGTPLPALSGVMEEHASRQCYRLHTLPQTLPEHTSLCFQTKNEIVRIFVDGRLIYTYGETPPLLYNHGVGAVWNIAALPEDAGGKPVIVELTPVDKRTGLAPHEFLLGSRDSIIRYLLHEKIIQIVVCTLMLLIGIGGLLLFAVGTLRKNRWARAVFHFSLFVLLSALWTATDSGLMQFLLPNKGVSYLLFGCSFYLFCTPFALFMADVEPQYRRLFCALSVLSSVYGAVRIILFVTGVLDFETALWVLHLMMGMFIAVTNVTLWLPAIRTKHLDQPELCIAVTVMTIIDAVSLVSFYAEDKLDVLRNGYASGFYWGILLFVLIVIVGAGRNAMQLRQQAFKAAFYERRAYTDDLTGLLNVKGFDDKCAAVLAGVSADECYAIVDFDVNYFSQYNASNGLDQGDALLKGIAASLKQLCGPEELIARQEADHFVCLLCGTSLSDIVERIKQADQAARRNMSARMLLLSYGVVAVTDHSASPAELRNQAVVAKRTVKGNYENNIAVYDHGLHELELREIELLAGFESALHNEEYVIFLQPKIDVATETLRGAEALVRHFRPDGSVVSAGPIIEALERKGFVAKLDYYILAAICKFLQRCMQEGRRIYPISGNFSRIHLYDADFPARVAEITDQYGIPRELIEIELTETAFLVGKDAMQNMVRSLHALGFRVSIDDFGSGYSSLNVLKDVEVDAVKLDREFLSDFAVNRRAGVVIEHTIHLAQHMHITLIAEGIETEEQLAFLRRLGCDQVQGYYYSEPLPEAEYIKKYLT